MMTPLQNVTASSHEATLYRPEWKLFQFQLTHTIIITPNRGSELPVHRIQQFGTVKRLLLSQRRSRSPLVIIIAPVANRPVLARQCDMSHEWPQQQGIEQLNGDTNGLLLRSKPALVSKQISLTARPQGALPVLLCYAILHAHSPALALVCLRRTVCT